LPVVPRCSVVIQPFVTLAVYTTRHWVIPSQDVRSILFKRLDAELLNIQSKGGYALSSISFDCRGDRPWWLACTAARTAHTTAYLSAREARPPFGIVVAGSPDSGELLGRDGPRLIENLAGDFSALRGDIMNSYQRASSRDSFRTESRFLFRYAVVFEDPNEFANGSPTCHTANVCRQRPAARTGPIPGRKSPTIATASPIAAPLKASSLAR